MKPADVSESAWEAASELLYAVDAMPSDGNILAVARCIQSATAAAYEDAARVALGYVDHPNMAGSDLWAFLIEELSAAIRARASRSEGE